jgi:hypothetical protein
VLKRLWLLAFLICSPLFGTTYYVANGGSDAANGTSTSTPWQTIAKVNGSSFSPGDSILFQAGGTWREQLTVPSSGSAGSPITFGVYGTGAQPIISGADLLTSWVSALPWYYASAVVQPNQVFRDDQRLTLAASKAALATGQWWWDSTTNRVYVCDDPTAHTIEASQRTDGISMVGTDYVTVSGIDVEKANGAGINILNSNNVRVTTCSSNYSYQQGILSYSSVGQTSNAIQVDNCAVAYNRGSGIFSNPYSNASGSGLIIQNNVTHDNAIGPGDGWDGAFTANIRATQGINITVQNNDVYNAGLGSSYAGSVGVGIWMDTPGTGMVVRNNIVYNNRLVGIVEEDGHTNSATDAAIYGNVVYGNGGTAPEVFGGADYGQYGIWIYRSNDGVAVYGNTLYGNDINIRVAGLWDGTAMNNIWVKNNIATGSVQGLNLSAIYGGANDTACGTCTGSGNVYTYNDFGTQASSFIEWSSYGFQNTYAAWEAATGNCGTTGCSHSTQTTPTFFNTTAGQLWMTAGSPGIASGTALGSPYNVGIYPGSSWPNGIFLIPNLNNDLGAFVYTGYVIDSVLGSGTQGSGTVR